MFFTGGLQQGIVKAVQEQKRVVCFVHSDSDESSEWKSNYLQPLSEIMDDHAVVLDLQEGSTEAGYLSAICPVESAPMVVVIYNGQVKGTLKPPMGVEEFRKQVLTAMDLNFRMSGPAGQGGASAAPVDVQPTPVSAPTNTNETTSTNPALTDAMAERRRRMADRELEESRRKQEAAQARERATQVPNSQEAYQAKLAAEKKKQRQAAAEEKQRVLDLIEADKKERRNQAAERAAERNALKAERASQQEQPVEDAPMEPIRSRSAGAGGKCRLQLRLWNGQTERAEFVALQTLGHVKEWLEKNIEPQAGPYTLREVIGVGAARQFTITDEAETLLSLGLAPSATLIVKPVTNAIFTSDGQERRNGMMRFILFPWVFLKELMVALWTMLLAFAQADQPNVSRLGTTNGERTQDPVAGSEASGVQAKRGDFSTLEDRDKKRDKPTLYNGNQLGVLPKADDEDDAQ